VPAVGGVGGAVVRRGSWALAPQLKWDARTSVNRPHASEPQPGLPGALIAQSDPAEYVPNLDPATIAAQLRDGLRAR